MYTETSDKWNIPRSYYEKGLHNYFIPYHRKFSGQILIGCFFLWHGINTISIYTLSDLGVLSNLIGSLSLANEHYSPPTE